MDRLERIKHGLSAAVPEEYEVLVRYADGVTYGDLQYLLERLEEREKENGDLKRELEKQTNLLAEVMRENGF